MNSCNFVGRVANDIEIKKTQNGKSVVQFILAVSRNYKNADGKYDADFLPIIFWDKKAEFIANNVKKGQKISVVARCQTRNYDGKDGKKVYVTEFIGSDFDYFESQQSVTKVEEEKIPF